MDNKDFDNLFKNQLNSVQEDDFQFEETAWEGVENVLNAEGILLPPQRNWKTIFPFLLLAFLFLTNGLVGWRYYTADQEVQHLTQKVARLENALMENKQQHTAPQPLISAIDPIKTETKTLTLPSAEPKETIKIVEKVVQKIVYVPINFSAATNNIQNPSLSFSNNYNHTFQNKTANIFNHKTANAANNDFQTNRYAFSFSKKATNNLTLENRTLRGDLINENYILPSEATIAAEALSEFEQVAKNAALNSLTLIPLSEITYDTVMLNPDFENYEDTVTDFDKKSWRDKLAQLSYATEITGGNLGLTSAGDFAYAKTDFKTTAFRIGLAGEVSFSDRVKLGASIEYKEINSYLDHIEELNYSDEYFTAFPDLASDLNPDDKLHKIEARERAVEWSVFAKYMFWSKQKLSPYLGAGIKGQYDYQQRFEYKYLAAPLLTFEYDMDYIYQYNQQFGINTFMALAGMEYRFLPRFAVKVEGAYNWDFKAHRFDALKYNWATANVGLLYHF